MNRHKLVEIDDDALPKESRSYRFACWCGKHGSWQPSKTAANGQHAVHRDDAARLEDV